MASVKNLLLISVLGTAPIWTPTFSAMYVSSFSASRTAYEKNCALPGAKEYLKLRSTRLAELVKEDDPHQKLNRLEELSKSPSARNCQDSHYKLGNELLAVSTAGFATGIVGGWFIGLPLLLYRMKKEKEEANKD